MSNFILTDWELADKDDYYFSERWLDYKKRNEVKKLIKEEKLYEAYLCPADSLIMLQTCDMQKIYIDSDCNIIVEGEITQQVTKGWMSIEKDERE